MMYMAATSSHIKTTTINPVKEALLRSWLLPYNPKGRTTYTPKTSTILITAAAQMCERSFFCSFAGSSAACSSSASMSSARVMLGCAVADKGGLGYVEGVLIDDVVAETVGAGDPAQDARKRTERRANDKCQSGHFAPKERNHDGEDARVDDDAAESQQPADSDPHVVEHNRQHRHKQAEAHDGYVSSPHELCS
ncbi:hypothetical protein KL936_004521 [Ogataea polymorpha]|nr:hypothetical protein KL936_004521 [Ogataea polymorpha]